LNRLLETVQSIAFSLIALLVVILLGIITDSIGTAAAAADLVPIQCHGGKERRQGKQAVRIVQNADLVANLTLMWWGISRYFERGFGASIVFSWPAGFQYENTVLLGGLMTA
jgi:hypothetical protein